MWTIQSHINILIVSLSDWGITLNDYFMGVSLLTMKLPFAEDKNNIEGVMNDTIYKRVENNNWWTC